MRKINSQLYEKLAQLLTTMGYELYGCEQLSQGRRSLLRLFIEKPTGVTAADCAQVSRQVDALLKVEQPYPSGYALEVSSPGINRSLFELEHYERCIGKKIKIVLKEAIENRQQYKGVLEKVALEKVYLRLEDNKEVVFPFSLIEKAHLVEA